MGATTAPPDEAQALIGTETTRLVVRGGEVVETARLVVDERFYDQACESVLDRIELERLKFLNNEVPYLVNEAIDALYGLLTPRGVDAAAVVLTEKFEHLVDRFTLDTQDRIVGAGGLRIALKSLIPSSWRIK